MSTLKILVVGSEGSGKTTVTNALLPKGQEASGGITFSEEKNQRGSCFQFIELTINQWLGDDIIQTHRNVHTVLLCVEAVNGQSVMNASLWLQRYKGSFPEVILVETKCGPGFNNPTAAMKNLAAAYEDVNHYRILDLRDLSKERKNVEERIEAVRQHLNQSLARLEMQEAFPSRRPHYETFLKGQSAALTALIQPKVLLAVDQSCWFKTKADFEFERNGLTKFKEALLALALCDTPYDLSEELTGIMKRINDEFPTLFEKHGSFKYLRGKAKAKAFLEEFNTTCRETIAHTKKL